MRLAAILILLMSAPATFSQGPEADILSYVISTVDTTAVADSVPSTPGVIDILAFVSATTDYVAPAPIPKARKTTVLIKKVAKHSSALDFISDTYSGHDYYTSGAWDDDAPCCFSFPTFTGNLPATRVPYTCTVSRRITSHFGYRPQFRRMHYGTDIAVPVGSEVRSCFAGTVSRCGYDRGYGHFVFIKYDNGFEMRLGHLSNILV